MACNGIAHDAVEDFARIVGSEHVITDPAERAALSNDIFFWDDVRPADLALRPADTRQVAEVVQTAAGRGLSVYIRGGGMSYTKGYVPTAAGTVLVDMRRLDKVHEINACDRYIVVGAGATWQSVAEALKPHGLQVAFGAPFSGVYSTVGGALAQGVPSGNAGVLGVEVVRADGSVLRTGSWARKDSHGRAAPFFREYGPDLTGLFLGDTGAFGIKTAAALRLTQKMPAAAHASFAFETYENMAACMIALGPHDFITRRVGLDPFKSQNSVKVGFKEALKTLGDVSTSGPTLLSGLKDSMKMASGGNNFMEGVKWSLHLSTEAINDVVAEAQIGVVRAICLRHGREIANFLPRAMDARRYSVRGFLGRQGQRWVPTNSIWPLSRAVEIATAVQAFFDARRAEMDRLGFQESYMSGYGPGYFLCEPSFYWRDEVSELHLRHLGADEAQQFRALQPNPEARAFAMKLRRELAEFFFEKGAVHVQIAKFYQYQASLDEGSTRLLAELKRLLDADGRLNAGNLGL